MWKRNFKFEIKSFFFVCLFFIFLEIFFVVAYAASPTLPNQPAGALWQNLLNIISGWVLRLGGVIIFVGGVKFGLAWLNNDADKKSAAISTIIGGALITSLVGFVSIILTL